MSEPIVSHLVHAECASEYAYWIDLGRLLRDGLYDEKGWVSHLRLKVWFTYEIEDTLLDAFEVGTAMRETYERAQAEEERRDREALARMARRTIRRPPPTPRNPRNISVRLRTFILERDDFRCRRCGCTADDARLVIDHIIPVRDGGTADPDNLQVLCDPCNAGKAAREPHEHDLRPFV